MQQLPTAIPRHAIGAVAFYAILAILCLAAAQRDPSVSLLNFGPFAAQRPVCSPYAYPGYLEWDRDVDPPFLEAVTRARWQQLTGDCPVEADWLLTLNRAVVNVDDRIKLLNDESNRRHWTVQQAAALERMSWLRDQTILIIGDSVDRNAVWQLAWAIGKEARVTSYADPTYVGAPEGWDDRIVPHRVDIPELNALVTNLFFHGTDDTDDFSSARDWKPPGLYEDRLEQMFKPYVEKLQRPVTFIQLHSGTWDLALFGRASLRNGISTNDPIPLESMHYYMYRLQNMINATQQAFPGVPLWFRKSHRIGPAFAHASGDYSSSLQDVDWPSDTHFFSDVRVHQLRQAQEIVCERMGIPVGDFGAVFEGWQPRQDKVHPLPLPGVFAYFWPLLHHVWMESQGRDRWIDLP